MSVKVRELRKGKFYLVVHYKGRRATSLHGPSRERAEESARLMEVALHTYGFDALKAWESADATRRPTFAEYAEQWLTEIENSTLSRSTIINYSVMLKKHVVPALGWHRIDDLRYGHIKAFALKQVSAYARDTVRLMLAATRAMLEEAVREELIQRNPAAHGLARLYRSAQKRRPEADPFTLEELHLVESVILQRFPEYYPFVLSLSRCGLRVGEAIALKWPDIDFADRLVLVRRNIPWHREEGSPKTKAGFRKVEMSDELAEVLLHYRAARQAEYLRKGRTRIPEWVFTTEADTPIHVENFRRRVWDRAQAIAGLRRRTIHDLRHTFATLHLMGGASVVWVKEQLGHSSIQVTVDLYKHWIPSQNRDGANRLDTIKNDRQNANSTQTACENGLNSGEKDGE